MDVQSILNIAFGLSGLLGGWVLKLIHSELNSLQRADRDLVSKVQAIEVLVAGEYVRKEHLERMYDRLFEKLENIENKLDTKVDK